MVTRVKVRKTPLARGLWTSGGERRVSSIFNTEKEYAIVRSISHYIQLPQMSDIYVSFKFLISREEASLITFQSDRVHFWCRTIPSAGTFTEMEILRGLFFSTFLEKLDTTIFSDSWDLEMASFSPDTWFFGKVSEEY